MNSTKIFKVIEFIKYEEKVTFFFLSKCFSKHPIINLWCRPHFSHRILSLSSTATQWPIKKKYFFYLFRLIPLFAFPAILFSTLSASNVFSVSISLTSVLFLSNQKDSTIILPFFFFCHRSNQMPLAFVFLPLQFLSLFT